MYDEVPVELSRSTNPVRAMHEYCLGCPAIRAWKTVRCEWTDPAWTAYVEEEDVQKQMAIREKEQEEAIEEQGESDSEEPQDPLDRRWLVGFTAIAAKPGSKPIRYYIQFRADANNETVLEVSGGKEKLKWFAIDHDHVRSGARAMFDEGITKLTAQYYLSGQEGVAAWLLEPGCGMSRRIDELNRVSHV